jgi:hypothetical protein
LRINSADLHSASEVDPRRPSRRMIGLDGIHERPPSSLRENIGICRRTGAEGQFPCNFIPRPWPTAQEENVERPTLCAGVAHGPAENNPDLGERNGPRRADRRPPAQRRD